MELPVHFDPLVTGLSILLGFCIAVLAFRRPLTAAFKRRAEDEVLFAGLPTPFIRGVDPSGVYDVQKVWIDGQPFVKASTLESAQARLAEIRAEKAASAAKPVSANEGGQP